MLSRFGKFAKDPKAEKVDAPQEKECSQPLKTTQSDQAQKKIRFAAFEQTLNDFEADPSKENLVNLFKRR